MKLENRFLYRGINLDIERDNNSFTIPNYFSKIKNIKPKVDKYLLTKHIYNFYFNDCKQSKRNNKIEFILNDINESFNYYLIDRILTIEKVWRKDRWNFEIQNAFYGEEVIEASLTNKYFNNITSKINNIISIKTLKEKVDKLLEYEYGHVINTLNNRRYKIDYIDINDIVILNNEYYDKVLKKKRNGKLSHYDIHNNSICGLVIKNKNKYNLIDGYHRYCGCNNKILEMIIAY